MINKTNLSAVFLVPSSFALAVAFAQPTLATEPGPLPYPPGGAGGFVAELPPIPGLFAVNQMTFSDSYSMVDDNGDKVPGSDLSSTAFANTVRILPSWGEYGGFKLYSQLVIPYVTGDVNLKFGGVTVSDDDGSGFGNLVFSPLIATRSFGDQAQHTFVVGYDYQSKIGTYDESEAFNPAVGYSSHQPYLGYRYDKGQGFYFATAVRGVFTQRNSDTDYRSGDATVADFRAGWKTGKLGIGLVGGYYNQYEDDDGPGAVSGKTELLKIGPSVSYNFGPVVLDVNYQMTAHARNAVKEDSLWVNVAIPISIR